MTHGYVGSMYGYSKDISIKNAPEDFVYYVPKGVEYTTTYTNYNINKNYHGVAQSKAVIFFILVAVLALAQQKATRSKEVQQ